MGIGAVYHRKKQKSHHSDTHRCVQEWIEPAGHKIDSGAPSTAHAFVPGTERTRRADVSPKQEQEPRQKTSDKKTADYFENHRCLTLLPAKFKSHGLRRWDNQARFSRSGNNAICKLGGIVGGGPDQEPRFSRTCLSLASMASESRIASLSDWAPSWGIGGSGRIPVMSRHE